MRCVFSTLQDDDCSSTAFRARNCRPCKRGGAAVPTMLALSGLSSVRTFETHSSRHLRVPSCLSLLREHVHSTRPGAKAVSTDTAPWCTTCCSTREQPPQRHPSRLPVESLRLPVFTLL